MINKVKVLIGSDIEVFFKDKTTGEYKSAIGLVGGTKQEPKKLEKDGCCVQEDNVAFEYNVPPVGLNEPKLMWDNIRYVVETVQKTLPENLTIECCSSAHFKFAELDNPKAQEFGCEPDYNAWDDGLPNPKPESATDLRSCGGHIHISYNDPTQDKSLRLVRLLDAYLGLPSVLSDGDAERRTLYGQAGSHRLKFFDDGAGGLEYRVLSNWWTKSEESVSWIFDQIEKALDAFNEDKDVVDYSNEILEAINTSNPELALMLCAQLNIELYEEATA